MTERVNIDRHGMERRLLYALHKRTHKQRPLLKLLPDTRHKTFETLLRTGRSVPIIDWEGTIAKGVPKEVVPLFLRDNGSERVPVGDRGEAPRRTKALGVLGTDTHTPT